MLRAFQPVLEREVFVLGGSRGPVPRWPLADFFEGLETAELKEISTALSAIADYTSATDHDRRGHRGH